MVCKLKIVRLDDCKNNDMIVLELCKANKISNVIDLLSFRIHYNIDQLNYRKFVEKYKIEK